MFKLVVDSLNNMRLAIVDNDRCRPDKCSRECVKTCPPNQMGQQCIEVDKKATISEDLCIGCNLCVKACPFNAISIINLPKRLTTPIYSYGPNHFRIYSFPRIAPGTVAGLIGQNGIGKSTTMKLLSGLKRPNFGEDKLTDDEIIRKVRGTSMQNYFEKLYQNDMKFVLKIQNIEQFRRKHGNKMVSAINGSDFVPGPDRKISSLSGGQLQKLICHSIMRIPADVYLFDEPSNFLDIEQRLAMAESIRELSRNNPESYVFVVDHDMSFLDYTCDNISLMYGEPGGYGTISDNYGSGEAINMYFQGYIRKENIRFRDFQYNMKQAGVVEYDTDEQRMLHYDEFTIKYETGFKLYAIAGDYEQGSVVLLAGPNGCGKTSFIESLAINENLSFSHKPQHLNIKSTKTVYNYLMIKIQSNVTCPMFVSDVIKPLKVKDLYDRTMDNLSGGELQRVAITVCLGTVSDIYLLDEPSASLDIEQRLAFIKVMKRFVEHGQKSCFVVEHDVGILTSLGAIKSSMIVFTENDGWTANAPIPFDDGMNHLLKQMNITMRRDNRYSRPRINKHHSQKDEEQKKSNKYYIA